ncbi:helix-turn-helix domain-containing protein [Flavisphingomonas formosensis]|uniref:helix-turn-helix domain-containing protein n=1 Tax=Flavisphingomonas formosensis TaxID=861534 RepID=UPI0012F758B9|nr:helix-turn-helix domain-containing protein [Sphingomonas formosensis]
MDSLITAAARALARGDPLGALGRIALREDPPALALRGITMAQLGDFDRARELLRRAAHGFGPRESVAQARCVVAEAEIAFVSRDLAWPDRRLEAARTTLEAHGDRVNAAHAHYLEARRLLLIGRLDEAERALAAIDPARLPPASQAAQALVEAGIAARRIRAEAARGALVRAERHAQDAGIPALVAEVAVAIRALEGPAARLIARGADRILRLDEVETLLAGEALVVDACRSVARTGVATLSFTSRPKLFALVRALAEAWPRDVSRETLLARAFSAREADESHRARLRVEIGRLRKMMRPLAGITATARGFLLMPRRGRKPVVLAPPVEGDHPEVLALLADGEAWPSSALALALGVSQRTVQRALDGLAEAGKAESFGRGRACRWIASGVSGFPTSLLLPVPMPSR